MDTQHGYLLTRLQCLDADALRARCDEGGLATGLNTQWEGEVNFPEAGELK